jgi:23S rRNA pseudouridine955/2504/2580 synthase
MRKKPIFKVSENDVDQRLDNYLLKQRKHIEKSNWYKLIRKGLIRVNGKRVKPMYKLSTGDEIRIPASIFFIEAAKVSIDPKLKEDLLQHVVFEDNDFLVLNKPAGLACHTGTGHQIGVVEIITAVTGYEQVQLAHRLDKDTSGCLLLAKNRMALLGFQTAMKNHQVVKTYVAVLDGILAETVVVDQPLDTENRINGIRTVVVSEKGKSAKTTFTPINNNGQKTLVECSIESGRTHQIRVHAQYLGLPVMGDVLYGKRTNSTTRKLHLHAKLLKFGDRLFEASLPAEFQSLF